MPRSNISIPADFNDHAEETPTGPMIEDLRSISRASSHDSENCPGYYGFGQGAPVHSCGCYDFRSRLSHDDPKYPRIPTPGSEKIGSDKPADSQHKQQIEEWQARAEEIRDCLPPPKLKRKRTESNEGSVNISREFGRNLANTGAVSAPASPKKRRRLGAAFETTGQAAVSGSVFETRILVSTLSTIETAIDRNTEVLSKICLALENCAKYNV
ncbi:hypothetical protein M405DRAFT_807718 [Rhizopogon salebrosus TDB-379]|nr:hypothetical protein M405DRAFT_807718 [Rhizopogon salebrosus TDB-379]